MAVITISRELGSEGDQIADLLCQELAYRRVDKAMLTEIAKETGVDAEAVLAMERNFARRTRLISSEMTSLVARQPSAFQKKGALDDQIYEQVVRTTMEQYAQEGDVIMVGRGGQMILREWPTACHVHLFAPPAVRIQRVCQRYNIPEQEAKRRVTESDEQKRQYIRHMYKNANWKNPDYYHLTINTAHISPEIAAQIIILAARQIEGAQAQT
jgi:cytidylate kinase